MDIFEKEEKGKEIVIPGEKVILNLKSKGKYSITVTKDSLTIKHKGALNAFNKGLIGEKTLMFKSMTGVQFKEPGMTTGYMQFIVMGSSENKKGVLGAVQDENTITFLKKERNLLYELKEYIEYRISIPDTVSSLSSADEIRKLKSLLDDGIITQSEFDAKKKQLLGL